MKVSKGIFNAVLAGVLVLFMVGSVQAVPDLINYQGYLADNGGLPVNGPTNITFRLYDAVSAGTLEWDSGSVSVNVADGAYSVILGENPQPAINASIFSKQLWLSVQVSGDPGEMSPRYKLTSAPYALEAASVSAPLNVSGSDPVAVISTSNSDTSEKAAGLLGISTAATGQTAGVFGSNSSSSGIGVLGMTSAASGGAVGVYGESASSGGMGVYGAVTSPTGAVYGVVGGSSSPQGYGVFGINNSGFAGFFQGDLGVVGDLTVTTGTISGNGSGLTNVNAATFDGKTTGEIDRAYRGPEIIDSVGGAGVRPPSMAIPSDGLPVIAYLNFSDLTSLEIRVAKCGNSYCTEGTSIGIDNGLALSNPSVSIGTDDLPVVVYGVGADMKVIHCNDASCSTRDDPEVIAGVIGGGTFISSITGSNGFPTIAFGNMGGITTIECSDLKCSSYNGPNFVPSPDSGIGLSWSLAMGGDKFPMFLSCAQNETRFHHCQDSACETFDPYVVVDSPCQLSSQNLITGSDSLPMLAYAVSTGLNVRHCANQGCTVMDGPVVLDSMAGGMAGSSVGMTLAPGGLPMLTYGIQTLRVARCNSTSCDKGFSIDILDRFANDTSYTDGALSDVEIGVDGIPVVAYYDMQVSNNNLLKIARHQSGWVRLEDTSP